MPNVQLSSGSLGDPSSCDGARCVGGRWMGRFVVIGFCSVPLGAQALASFPTASCHIHLSAFAVCLKKKEMSTDKDIYRKKS
ncbi:hypothetical protein H920_20332 [Fukomys damarensis]|uniref:Uncharacterized protein n=1 Tax=Fukomys damarensis TaxID=885580 RepID=A0A091CIK3_FUKDA|nr:hypothetical protein H920_20332 [Fukomys damarensis]